MLFSTLSDYINANAPMSNIPELLGLHHGNPLGLHPIAVPALLLVLAVAMRVVLSLIYRNAKFSVFNLPFSTIAYPLLYGLWWMAVAAAYYYCFSSDLPLFTDVDLGRQEVCIGWFCQRQVVGIGWSVVGVALLTFTVYAMMGVLLHIIAHQSDRMGLGEKQWREWSWIILVMLLGASAAGIADDIAPITGVWIMIAYHVAVLLMVVVKFIADSRRTHLVHRCLLSALCFLVAFEAVTMLAIECIEGYVYLFIPIVGLFVSVDAMYKKKHSAPAA